MFQTSAIVSITDEKCVGCRRCVNVCPSDALAMDGRLAVLDAPNCVGCFKCVEACHPYDAISAVRDPDPRRLAVDEGESENPAVDDLCAAARLARDSVICVCTSTTAGEVAAAILLGAREPEELTLATGVRAKCGMWCLAPTLRLLKAHGIALERSAKDHRVYPDAGSTEVAVWTIPDEVADKYPEYRLRADRDAVEDGSNLNSPTPWFADIRGSRS